MLLERATSVSAIPASHVDLLERPVFGHLATIRPDGNPQVTPMWFSWDGELLAFTTSTLRRKDHHVVANPAIAVSINDPEQPYRCLRFAPSSNGSSPTRTRTSSSGSPSGTSRPSPAAAWATRPTA